MQVPVATLLVLGVVSLGGVSCQMSRGPGGGGGGGGNGGGGYDGGRRGDVLNTGDIDDQVVFNIDNSGGGGDGGNLNAEGQGGGGGGNGLPPGMDCATIVKQCQCGGGPPGPPVGPPGPPPAPNYQADYDFKDRSHRYPPR